MSPFTKNIIILLVINFTALGIGGFLMGEGPSSTYYQGINKAPWTPPGWVFGAAWTTIMICFSVYMAYWLKAENEMMVWALFALQFVLNVGWNPLFFNFHMTLPALIVIIALTVLVGYFLFGNWDTLGTLSLLIAPYFIWLCIATSLNWYILIKN
ncbi:tryptophan-rich sensory protein [Bacteroidia bacterium]|nr:tryptophan-rich sensory protein [Bacteroidia bacterium]MDB9881930.1 tryptophan-rich sensory protein [Bacteroidia bacterium]MDC1394879.1 tryptophan-rich sensory protein [Bacteroidia bacterium]